MVSDKKLAMIEWVAAARPLHGQMLSGDRRMVRPCGEMDPLPAIDNWRHGEEAITEARAPAEALVKTLFESAITPVRCCCQATAKTRKVMIAPAPVDGHAITLPITKADSFMSAADVMQPGFESEGYRIETSQPGANQILSRHFKGNDNALVLVV